MSVAEPGSTRSSLVERVRSILTRPSATWDVIDGEPATVEGLYRNYILPLAAIPPICSLVGMLVFGIGAFGFTFRPNPIWAVAQAVVSYVLNLVMIYVVALVIDGLAPTFDGAKDRIQALKLAAYSGTAAWVAGVFGLIPMLGVLALIGAVWSLYTLYRGLPKLMKTPADKAAPYFVVVLVVTIVIGIVIGMATSMITRIGAGPMGVASAGRVSGTINVPGGGSIDLAKLQQASKQAEAAAGQIESGKATPATDPQQLKGYLPDRVSGFNRTEVSAASGGAGGIQGSTAEGVYSNGEGTIHLSVTDVGAAGALAGTVAAFNVNASRETPTGYDKVGRVDGRMTQESYDREEQHGEYSVLVGDRFIVQATGDHVGVGDLKTAVAAVGVSRLEGLAKAGS